MEEILCLEGIKARYPYSKKDVLQGIDLKINQGDFIALLGPNGAGKSTLFKVIYGILPCLEGQIYFKKKRIDKPSPVFWLRNGIRYLPQGSQIFQDLSVTDNFSLAGRFLGESQIKKEMEEFLDFLEGIPDKERIISNLNKRSGILSGGQRQIISLGMALLGKPKFLLLDEPTAGLAPKISENILSWLKKQNKTKNLTLLVVEHHLGNVLNFSNRIVNMNYGKVFEMHKEDFTDVELLRKKVLQSSDITNFF